MLNASVNPRDQVRLQIAVANMDNQSWTIQSHWEKQAVNPTARGIH
jgi:hypothetical protein